MIAFLDGLLHAMHLSVIAFNLFGWISKTTRRVHRWCVGFTAFFWMVIGPVYGGIGYCPLTDWHWQVKSARGEKDLPASYIDYLLRKGDILLSPSLIDVWVGAIFACIFAGTVILWWRERRDRICLD